MKHLRQHIRQILLEGMQTVRLHHSRASDRVGKEVNFGPYPQKSAESQIGPVKPDGIWYDCEGQWKDFCETDLGGYGRRGYDVVYEIIPNESTVLFITNDQEFDDFEKTYGRPGKYELVIDWAEVADQYDGIEICPYLSSKRPDHFWYYPWDVPSGCIWSPRGAKAIEGKC